MGDPQALFADAVFYSRARPQLGHSASPRRSPTPGQSGWRGSNRYNGLFLSDNGKAHAANRPPPPRVEELRPIRVGRRQVSGRRHCRTDPGSADPRHWPSALASEEPPPMEPSLPPQAPAGDEHVHLAGRATEPPIMSSSALSAEQPRVAAGDSAECSRPAGIHFMHSTHSVRSVRSSYAKNRPRRMEWKAPGLLARNCRM
jgi:hypothetical protein